MSIGLQRGTVVVEPHQIEWEISAHKMINKLKHILQEDMVDAQHIGSTSIRNIYAKPIIDIVVGVNSFDKITSHNDILKSEGIVYRGEDHPGQLLYVCGDLDNEVHTHYIHVVLWEQETWNNYINMRDYLNAHEERALEYSELKKCLAKEYAEDRTTYTNRKSAFIEAVLRNAYEWRKQ